jgi:hypothetical protein
MSKVPFLEDRRDLRLQIYANPSIQVSRESIEMGRKRANAQNEKICNCVVTRLYYDGSDRSAIRIRRTLSQVGNKYARLLRSQADLIPWSTLPGAIYRFCAYSEWKREPAGMAWGESAQADDPETSFLKHSTTNK